MKQLATSFRHLFSSKDKPAEPRKVAGTFNSDTTSSKDPAIVRDEIIRVLQASKVEIADRGFVIKATYREPDAVAVSLIISVEVCLLERLRLTGIKLRRVKGDAWAYKKVRWAALPWT